MMISIRNKQDIGVWCCVLVSLRVVTVGAPPQEKEARAERRGRGWFDVVALAQGATRRLALP